MLARARLEAVEQVELKGLLMTGLVMLLVVALGIDVFYGVSGAIFWYLIGKALWLADHARTGELAGQTQMMDRPSRAGTAPPQPAGVGITDLGSSR